ncbi:N-acyl homoserine lactonase family protein [Parasediminibacterium paludis]|uniref:N-acyl homoserine lactonase family protein n=1 Tax=Parasediminibacterium paludis TaxID=908966 RepID=A0ABV8PUQ0_9BACT
MERRKFLNDSAKYAALTMAGASIISNKAFASHVLNDTAIDFKNTSATDVAATYQNVSTVVKLRGKDVKIHGLCTGTVAVKRNFRTKKGNGSMAKINILLDHHYTDYMPIWVWIIEHPDGIIAIDTGEIADSKNVETFLAKESAYSKYVLKRTSKKNIEKEDELNYQLEKIKLKPDDIGLVVLTHLHLDHTDGLKFFPKQEIIVGNMEFKKPYSNAPSTYPNWFKPNLVNYTKGNIEIFDQAYPINTAGDLFYVPTPGHTHGHSSVIFKTDEYNIIFAGDTSYNQGQVLRGELAGVNADFGKSKETYTKLIAFANQKKTIYLPSHDENSGNRLLNRSFMVNI